MTFYQVPNAYEVRDHLVRAIVVITDQMPDVPARQALQLWAANPPESGRPFETDMLAAPAQYAMDWSTSSGADMALTEALTLLWWASIHATHGHNSTAQVRADWAVQALAPGLTFRPTSSAYAELLQSVIGRAGWLPPTLHDRETMVVRYLSPHPPRIRGWLGVYADYNADGSQRLTFWRGGVVLSDGTQHRVPLSVGSVWDPIQSVESHAQEGPATA